MNVWREEQVGREPKILSGVNILVALLLHVLVFVAFWLGALVQGFLAPKETIIPIDLTLVVNENLDGKDDEPPPLANPPEKKMPNKPSPPKPTEEKKKDPPKPLEQIVTNVVKKVEKKKPKEPEKKTPPKKDEPPKKTEPPKKDEKKKTDEKPKKSAKELREERMKRMRESAVKNTKPVKIEVKGAQSGNGRTGKQTLSEAEIRRLLDAGYKPGREESLATSELQLGVSLIQMALNEKWDRLAPKVGASGTVLLSCRLNSAGGLVKVRLAKSCGDALSDRAVLQVAQSLHFIEHLPKDFLKRFSKETLTIRYQVRGR